MDPRVATNRMHILQGAPCYRERPELDRVEAWFRDGPPGVCALVGLGGAGKTALAERFLARIPGGDSVFVFSFYEEPAADTLFAVLGSWIGARAGAGHLEVLDLLAQADATRLLVLDGLERVQSDGGSTELGEIESVPLRDLLMRAATGLLGLTRVLATTRFPITPIEREAPAGFVRIDIGPLGPDAALALAKMRGARGSDDDLRRMVGACAGHALLVDLTAACSAEMGEELPTQLDEVDRAQIERAPERRRSAHALQRRFERAMNRYRQILETRAPEAWALLRIARLFRHSVTVPLLLELRAMELSDLCLTLRVDPDIAASFPIAEMVGSFALRGGIPAPPPRHVASDEAWVAPAAKHEVPAARDAVVMTFRATFGDDGKLSFAPSAPFAARTQVDAVVSSRVGDDPSKQWTQGRWLDRWVRMRLTHIVRSVELLLSAPRSGPLARESLDLLQRLGLADVRNGRVQIHPAVRDALGPEPSGDALGHRRVLTRLAPAILSARPGATQPSFVPYEKDRYRPPAEVEELLHHLIGGGHHRIAWSFYHQNLGGYRWLGLRHAKLAHGEALLSMLAEGRAPNDTKPQLDPAECAAFFNEWGLYLMRLGRLAGATTCFRRAAALAIEMGRPWLATVAFQNQADAEVLRGELPAARTSILSAARSLSGGEALERVRPEEAFARDSPRERLPALVGIGRGRACEELDSIESLLHRGAWLEAERLCRLALIGARTYHASHASGDHALLSVILAETSRELGDRARAIGHARLAREISLRHDDRELLARAHLEEARLAMLGEDGASAERSIAEARRIALDAGFGTLLVDLTLIRAEMALARSDAREFTALLALALEGSPDEGWRGASDPRCGYARGEARARSLSRGRRSATPARGPGAILVVYGYRDSQWLEELLRGFDEAHARLALDFWHDALDTEPIPAGRVVAIEGDRFRCPPSIDAPLRLVVPGSDTAAGSPTETASFAIQVQRILTALAPS
jgi:tetratricopeptide (TPR) repeat protein